MNKSPEIHTPWYGRMSVQLVEINGNKGFYWIVDERIDDTDGIFAESETYKSAGDAWRAMMNNDVMWETCSSDLSGVKTNRKRRGRYEEVY